MRTGRRPLDRRFIISDVRPERCAKATFANTEALAFYRSAIAQVEQLDSTKEEMRISAAQLNEEVGDVLTLVGELVDARATCERARSLVPDSDSIWRSRLYRKTGFSHNLQRHYQETGRAYDSTEEELGRNERPFGRVVGGEGADSARTTATSLLAGNGRRNDGLAEHYHP